MKRSELINSLTDLLDESMFSGEVVAEVEAFLDELEEGFNEIRDKIKSIDFTTLDMVNDAYDIADSMSDKLY